MNEYFKKGALRAMSEEERESIITGNLFYEKYAKTLFYHACTSLKSGLHA